MMASGLPGDAMTLPSDGHVHTEWSWDAPAGSMEASCARAIELGLPSIAFTEHADFAPWVVEPESLPRLPNSFRVHVTPEGIFQPPVLDVAGYLECVRRCRDRFPALRILSGVEMSEPHWFSDRAGSLVRTTDFDRILGSVHSVQGSEGYIYIDRLYKTWPADQVVRAYLAEVLRMVESSSVFEALAHIDYPIRAWPEQAGLYDPVAFEEEYRSVLNALARTGRALEVNTRVPLHAQLVRWWYEVGGQSICFGSDAHDPTRVALDFVDAAAMVEAQGFRPGRSPHDFWTKSAVL
jgi:histidinol-phosphatase (PHP family)